MSAAPTLLTEAEWSRKMRQDYDVRDKSYRRYPIGQDVGAFMRALRVERRAPSTRDSYETTLRRFTLDHRDFDSLLPFCEQGGVDLLFAFLDRHWGDSSGDTMGQRAACLNSFFKWAKKTKRIPENPMEAVRVPRVRTRLRHAHELAQIKLIASAQRRMSDEAAILVMGRLGLRKMEAAGVQARDVDLAHDEIHIRHAKGNKPAQQPIEFEDVRQALSLWLAEPGRHPEDYLIATERGRRRKMNQASVHRWFVRCCERAGVLPIKMHELRHSAADRLWRETGNLIAAQKLLRHERISTTEDYLHGTVDDLRAWMRESDR